MNLDDYLKALIRCLLIKLYRRPETSTKRPWVVPSALYSSYRKDNRDIDKKKLVDEAVAILEKKGIVTVTREEYSSDVLKIYLELDKVSDLENMAEKRGIKTRIDSYGRASVLKKRYGGIHPCIDAEIETMLNHAWNKPLFFSRIEEENLLKAATFLARNKKELYIREASMFIFGNSKLLEKKYEAKVLSLFRLETLEPFKVRHTDSFVHLRGPVTLYFGDHMIDVSAFQSGFCISWEDMQRLVKKIEVRTPILLTIENKTSFLRHLPDGYATFFLSGFATDIQIECLKRIVIENPGIKLCHFGDIDAGGLRILKHLRTCLGNVEGYHMGIEELRADLYRSCLQELEANDREILLNELYSNFPALVGYMLENNVKLEQEIVSYFLEEGV